MKPKKQMSNRKAAKFDGISEEVWKAEELNDLLIYFFYFFLQCNVNHYKPEEWSLEWHCFISKERLRSYTIQITLMV